MPYAILLIQQQYLTLVLSRLSWAKSPINHGTMLGGLISMKLPFGNLTIMKPMLKNDQSSNYFFSHHLYISYTIALNYQSINISTKPQRTINYIEFVWHVPIAEPPNIVINWYLSMTTWWFNNQQWVFSHQRWRCNGRMVYWWYREQCLGSFWCLRCALWYKGFIHDK